MKTEDWKNDDPTKKQIDLFNSLKVDFGYKGNPKTKGEYRTAIGELLEKQNNITYYAPSDNDRDGSPSWMDFYDDDYLGDQGIFPGY